MDVETAYLYSNLSHEVCMAIPDGYVCQTSSEYPLVLRLQKALYGLEQLGREWFGELRHTVVDKMRMTPLSSDPCVFFSDNLVVAIHVDDIVITGNEWAIASFKLLLAA